MIEMTLGEIAAAVGGAVHGDPSSVVSGPVEFDSRNMVDGGDRRAAIGLALEVAQPGDVVAILGKGHETGQEIGGQVLPFGDAEVVHEQWAARRVAR